MWGRDTEGFCSETFKHEGSCGCLFAGWWIKGSGGTTRYVPTHVSSRVYGSFEGLGGRGWVDGIGVIMTASDAGIKKLDVIGPPDTMQYVGTLRASVYRQTMGINTIAYSSPSSSSADSAEEDGNVYGGTGLTVRSIALRPQTDNGPTGHVNAESGPSRLSPTETANLARRHVRNMFPNGASCGSPLHIPRGEKD